ncbi:MAG TPA: imidazole glycerol phosphate synthase subunit HisF [Opitutae bacterium]|nr:imidazole glycerol phosphate synthase subunit HisF [Puniceicoccaceae bacterium]HBR94199.1 imidazole glycerol phosphate synthase subunit HisF [Opitutae bacterium]|tara:strand:- start:4976 stop:5743 length:768 start_codon:yes stop_codon:yes gene_type:complete
MLKTRIIPTLLWKDFGLVKGEAFDSWRRVGAVLPAIRVYNRRDVDELILVDITATPEGNEPDYVSVQDFALDCMVPLTVGGGIRNIDQIRQLLSAGADKVSINTAAYDHPELITEASDRFGVQCIVSSIDVKRHEDGHLSCHSHSGQTDRGLDPVEWAKKCVELGAGEILLTSVDRDGMMNGYDIDLVKQVSSAVNIPVIASGGAGNYQHLIEAVKDGGASAVALASIFHFTEATPAEARSAMKEAGIPVRKTLK